MIQENMEIQIFSPQHPIRKTELQQLASAWFGDMVKAVADVENNLVAIGGEWHADAESLLLTQGSQQENLWGFNLYPFESAGNFIVFDSLINIRPRQNNRSMTILDIKIQKYIRDLINKVIME